jgi:hypothetical protein
MLSRAPRVIAIGAAPGRRRITSFFELGIRPGPSRSQHLGPAADRPARACNAEPETWPAGVAPRRADAAAELLPSDAGGRAGAGEPGRPVVAVKARAGRCARAGGAAPADGADAAAADGLDPALPARRGQTDCCPVTWGPTFLPGP